MAKRRWPTLEFWIWLIVAGIVVVLVGLALDDSPAVGERGGATSRVEEPAR